MVRLVNLPDHLPESRRYTCCFCLHVRTGTILLGIGQIILHLVCISLLILSALRPDVLPSLGSVDKDNGYGAGSEDKSVGRSHALSIILHLVPGISDLQDTISVPPNQYKQQNGDSVATDSTKVMLNENAPENDNNEAASDEQRVFVLNSYKQRDEVVPAKHRRHFSPYFALCLSTFSLAFCCFLVHGAVARQPTHLLPFFFLQVFDFIISLLTVVGYLSSTSDVRFWLHMKHGSMYLNSTSITFLMLSISCLFLAFKAYCLGMVWDCYKYLMLTYHRPDQGSDWSSDPFSFFPSIWGFLGTGRRSSLFRVGTRGAPDHPLFATLGEGDARGPQRAPATYDQSNDLPNYDDALKMPANAYAPPPYFVPGDTTKTTAQPSEPVVVPPTTTTTTTTTNNSAATNAGAAAPNSNNNPVA